MVEAKLKLSRRTKAIIRKIIIALDDELNYYVWDTKEFNRLQEIIDNMIELLENSEYIEPSKYNPCPICGGEVDLILDTERYGDFDVLADTFQCTNCKTTFNANQMSDVLYMYFKKNK